MSVLHISLHACADELSSAFILEERRKGCDLSVTSSPPTRPRSLPRWRQREVTRVGVSIYYTVCELVTESCPRVRVLTCIFYIERNHTSTPLGAWTLATLASLLLHPLPGNGNPGKEIRRGTRRHDRTELKRESGQRCSVCRSVVKGC